MRSFRIITLPVLLLAMVASLVVPSVASASSSYSVAVCKSVSPVGGLVSPDSISGWTTSFCSNPTSSQVVSITVPAGTQDGVNTNDVAAFWAPTNEGITTFSFQSSAFSIASNASGGWQDGFGAYDSSHGGGNPETFTSEFPGIDCSGQSPGCSATWSNGTFYYNLNGDETGPWGEFTIWIACRNTAGCSSGNGVVASMTGVSATLQDPNNSPTLSTSGSLWSDGSATKWYSGAGLDNSSTVSSTDDGGTCYLYPTLTPTSSATNGGNTIAPSVYSSGYLNDTADYSTAVNQFTTSTCSNASAPSKATISNLAAVPSGSYYLNAQAQNPAQYASGEAVAADSSFLSGSSATAGEQLNIDNVTPTLAWSSTSSAYSTATTEKLNVTVGSSGMGSVTCVDNGASVVATAVATNPSSGAGTYSYNIPTVAQGANSINCSATNGDSAAALTGTAAPQTFNVDTTSPTVTVPATNSSWISSPASLAVGTTSGPSGIASLTCTNSLNSDVYSIENSSGVIPASDNSNGVNTWTCQATSGAGLASALATVTEKLDSSSPSGSLSGDSAGAWYNTP